MNIRWVRLIGSPPGALPQGPPGFLDDLAFLRAHRGEKIAALAPATGELLGVLGLRPEPDEGGMAFRLTGLEVLPGSREAGVEAALLEQAGAYMKTRRSARLKIGTSPLLTANAELYVTGFGARYRWREGPHTPGGQPWPHVSCEIDFEDALARPLDLRDDEIASRSVLEWNGGVPRRTAVTWSGALTVLLPDLDADSLARAAAQDPSLPALLHGLFHDLSRHGYGFAWFDRLPPAAGSPGGTRWYYLMSRLIRF